MKNTQGKFITFEGADGVGKSTQVAFITDLLCSLGKNVLLVREPGATKIGEKVRDLLLDVNNDEMTDESELLFYLSARSQIVNEVIKPALSQNKIVFCDRFFDSTLAYQGFGRQMDLDFIKRANDFVCKGLVPDRTILFYIPSEVRKKRVERREATDRIEGAGFKFSERVANGFLEIANFYENKNRIVKVDSSGRHSQTALSALSAISDLVDIDINCDFVKKSLNELDEAHVH